MFTKYVIPLVVALYVVHGKMSVKESLLSEEVIPDVIKTAPEKVSLLQVEYSSGSKANLGNELTPTQVKDIPTVSWKTDKNSFYLLCLTDPDAPSRKSPSNREWHHWLVGNIPGDDISKGEVLSEYVGSGPPKGTGLHRYVFFIYKQPGKVKYTERLLTNRSANGRGNFSIEKFASKYNLGDPIAANFYQAQWDEYVPILYKQLGV